MYLYMYVVIISNYIINAWLQNTNSLSSTNSSPLCCVIDFHALFIVLIYKYCEAYKITDLATHNRLLDLHSYVRQVRYVRLHVHASGLECRS